VHPTARYQLDEADARGECPSTIEVSPTRSSGDESRRANDAIERRQAAASPAAPLATAATAGNPAQNIGEVLVNRHSGRVRVTRPLLFGGPVILALSGVGLTYALRSPDDVVQKAPGPYVAATIRPTAPQAVQDAAVRTYYTAWKSAFLRRDCGAGTVQVYSPDAAYPYVAEAQAYGLVITVSMAAEDPDAKALFDGILRYVVAHPSVNNPDLMAAEQDSDCTDAGGANSATDGDLDIAYALLLAAKRWGGSAEFDYGQLALKRIRAIKKSEVHPASKLMLLGDWSKPADPPLYRTSRTSDWIVHHFRAFKNATGDDDWDAIRVAHQQAISSLQTRYSPATGLLPDFVRTTQRGVEPVDGKVLESDHDGDYHFNACRDPWRIGLDAITSGDASSVTAVRKINAWAKAVTGGDPDRLGTGYTLAGLRYGEGANNAFWAPRAVAAMSDPGSQDWLDALWVKMAGNSVSPDNYYGVTVQLQVMLIVSGRYLPL
jgi:endo-1,4-beta-D-glucanase Y